MILLIDMGNQRLKWALLSTPVPEVPHQLLESLSRCFGVCDLADIPSPGLAGPGPAGPGDSIPQTDNVFSSLPWPDAAPQSIWVSSVSNDSAATVLTQYCEEKWRCRPRFVSSPPACHGLVNHYDRPAQLGVDRWLAALGAFKLMATENKAGVVVVDAGTAVTVDLVYDRGFRGGVILPGLNLITDSLGSRTGRIRLDNDRGPGNRRTQSHDSYRNGQVGQQPSRSGLYAPNTPPEQLFSPSATNSNEGVKSGAMAAVLGGVRYCVEKLMVGGATSPGGRDKWESSKLSSPGNSALPVLVTGGDAGLVGSDLFFNTEMRNTPGTVQIVPNLVLAGLAITAAANVDPVTAAETGEP